ncbi:hypothetical protein PGT21_019197 [Puccinia graminis f. sp. tritici]|uniref:Uncharacterized protein n=2 Tax=Puccinia graminis f. sp. tritici TaxID=56615 RepID=E3KJL7_PUCGT|nr:uncharacterized protein PGTG_10212 [Puccinia graminis f. sp. tritici CRL 75-36-700-3]EFP84492.2 hypothetical protein PGTG_10212 [Puccinia graminis f. sp. tritici CRL 75-36-700-3]KAA1092956.1 hypothetical protein PGT21_019197 [Puccinia graminis f. sp. tritici]KAA1115712.1 hypothetical protein PGTUg99_027821 [Puccinia graminis f. sp. tritici]
MSLHVVPLNQPLQVYLLHKSISNGAAIAQPGTKFDGPRWILCSNGPAKQPATHPQWLSNPRPPATFGSPIPSRNPPFIHSSTSSTSQIPPTSQSTQAFHSFNPN